MIERRVFHLRAAADTQALAAALALALPPGVLVLLQGDLGAGKTTFAQGMARGLGVREAVISPTFILIREYELPEAPGRPERFVHLDLYRLSGPAELPGLGLDELIDDAQVVVEWPERGEGRLPEAEVEVSIRPLPVTSSRPSADNDAVDAPPSDPSGEPRRIEILARGPAADALRRVAPAFEAVEEPSDG